MKHTPGPWKAVPFTSDNPFSDDASWMIVAVDPMRGRIDSQIVGFKTGDAHLAAAAPELLDACVFVRDYLQSLEDNLPEGDQLRAVRRRFHKRLLDKLLPAIAKAEGRT